MAARLTGGKTAMFILSSRTRFILGVLATYVTGLLTIIAGVIYSSPFLVTSGAAVTMSLPVGWQRVPGDTATRPTPPVHLVLTAATSSLGESLASPNSSVVLGSTDPSNVVGLIGHWSWPWCSNG